MLETEDVTFDLDELAVEVLELWTQDPADHHERYLLEWMPHTMQQVLDGQLTALYRHLVWDLGRPPGPPSLPPRSPLHPVEGLPLASLLAAPPAANPCNGAGFLPLGCCTVGAALSGAMVAGSAGGGLFL